MEQFSYGTVLRGNTLYPRFLQNSLEKQRQLLLTGWGGASMFFAEEFARGGENWGDSI